MKVTDMQDQSRTAQQAGEEQRHRVRNEKRVSGSKRAKDAERKTQTIRILSSGANLPLLNGVDSNVSPSFRITEHGQVSGPGPE